MPDILSVPSYPQLKVTSDGKVIGPSGKTLSDFPDRKGYRRVNIWKTGHWKQLGVHRLVCEAFHGPAPEGRTDVAHGDGDPGNNRPENLRWATERENEDDKRRHGRNLEGERHHQAKLTENDVREIRKRRANGEMGIAIATLFGITPTQVCAIHRRRSWKHVQ